MIALYLTNWWGTFLGAFFQLWNGIAGTFAPLLGAALILLVGWFLAIFLGQLIKKILGEKNIAWSRAFSSIGLSDVLEDRLGLSTDVGAFLGWLVKWFLIIASFMAAMSVLQLAFVNEFLGKLIAFLPVAVTSALIVFVGFLLGGFMSQVLKRLINSLNIGGAEIAGLSVRWVVVFFSIFTALKFLLPTLDILTSKFADFLLFAAALAVGVGLSKKVGEWMEKIKS